MSPYQHGEVFVTEDGGETDLDLGHYERFLDQSLSRYNNITSGMIYWEVLSKERKGDYLGKTVQIIPHVTNEIKQRIQDVLKERHYDIIITEIGGTIGDIESLPFVEAIRQFQFKNKADCMHIHLTLVPFLKTSNEFKTKPTQHSVKELRSIGIQPDIVLCRSLMPLSQEIKEKIALFSDVDIKSVISAVDVESIYDVPLVLQNEKLDDVVCQKLSIENKESSLESSKNYIQVLHNPTLKTIQIAIVGKYVNYSDCYISVVEALRHAATNQFCKVELVWVDSELLEKKDVEAKLSGVAGVLVPGGFGERGIEGKILACEYAREKDVPYLGLCLGMHVAVIEFARNQLKLKGANSAEFNAKSAHAVIDLLEDQKNVKDKGGTMRLGRYPCKIKKGTKLHDAYKELEVSERHRHRYEFNDQYRKRFEDKGMILSGLSPDNELVEVVENKSHKWFVACQFHPEFKSRPTKPHPLFKGFIAASKSFAGIQQALFDN